MATPTEWAEAHFESAMRSADEAARVLGTLKVDKGVVIQASKSELGEFHTAGAVRKIAHGLKHLSVGLRATYILLEEINRKLPK
jgi:hypothetical protein